MIDYTKFEDFDNHQLIIEMNDPASGLRGYIAIHRSNNNRAIGGTRVYPYATAAEALRDVLRLSRAMTSKCAVARLEFGGGKAVIMADPRNKSEKLLKKYAEYVQNSPIAFYTGEDVGMEQSDVDFMSRQSDFFIGRKYAAGDPSVYAALSVYKCIKTALGSEYGNVSLKQRSIAIKGLGKTGLALAKLGAAEGATIFGADVNSASVELAQQELPQINIVGPEKINSQEVDVYAPCALGDEFSYQNVDLLKAKFICGTANNQLEHPEIGNVLFKKGIVYIPDYLANAGGLINVADELEAEGYNRRRVIARIAKLSDTLREVLAVSRAENLAPSLVTDRLAQKIILQKIFAI